MPHRRPILALLIAVPAFLLPVSCGNALAGGPRNVVLISIDTLRADHVGCYGAKNVATPNMDRLAAKGVRFDKAWSAVPVTTPSHASLFTGTYPLFHGVRSNGSFVLPEERTTLAELFKAKGFETAGFVGAFPLDHQFGLQQGFDTWDDKISRAEQSMSPYDAERRGSIVVDHALGWLRGREEKKPFFLFVHLYDPHQPYMPPEAFRTRYPDDPYAGEIAYVDEQIGRLLAALDEKKLGEDTLIALVSDHGESLGEHGEKTHMIFVYDATLRVPMILSGGGLPQGKSVSEPARLIDLLPTIAKLTGLPSPREVQGVDLSPTWSGGSVDPKRIFYAESMLPQVQFDWAPLQSVRNGKWKFILAPQRELYDLEADPNELVNLMAAGEPQGDAADALSDLQRLLKRAQKELTSPDAGKSARAAVGSDAQAKLQSLGYLGNGGSSVDSGTDPMTLPDPKTRIEVYNLTESALAATARGRSEEAVAIYEKVLRDYPTENWIVLTLARTLMSAKRWDDVLHVLAPATIAKLPAATRTAAYSLRAGAFEDQSKWKEALAEWEVIAKGGGDGSTRSDKGRGNVLIELRKFDAALPLLEKAVAADPKDATSQELLGRALLGVGKDTEGIAALAKARELDPKASADPKTDPRMRAASFLVRMEKKDRAGAILRSALGDGTTPANVRSEAQYLLANISGAAPAPGEAGRIEASRRKAAAGDFAGAAADLQAVVASGNANAAVHYDLAVCFLNLGRLPEAKGSLQHALAADQKFVPALADFGWIAEKEGDRMTAGKYYRRASDLDPTYYPALSRLGILFARMGKHDESVAFLERAMKVQPNDPDAHFNLSVALGKAGRTEDAKKAAAEAQRLAAKRGARQP